MMTGRILTGLLASVFMINSASAGTGVSGKSTIETVYADDGFFRIVVYDDILPLSLHSNPQCQKQLQVEKATHDNYEAMVSTILTAFAAGLTVHFHYDDTSTWCNTKMLVVLVEK